MLQWRRQYNAFSKALPGKVLWIAFLIWGFRTGLFFRLLNILSILFWLAPLIILPLARKFSQQVGCLSSYAMQLGITANSTAALQGSCAGWH